jgi:2-polyprenyl-3-methyl-5-hydroxy-6-metoxy-1,4-benzoquinol methylase
MSDPLTAWACPDHRTPLRSNGAELTCERRHAFSIIDGIPRFVQTGSYAAGFGPQWLKYRQTQLDSFTGESLSANRARRCIGEHTWNRLEGAHVLECGCGAGRFTEVLLARGAAVTSIDMTEAVEADQANFPQDDRHRIAQADILKLPFVGRGFDVVFCLGVLQHTPVPEQAMAALFEQVRPGGLVVVDHYRYRPGYFLSTQPIARAVLRRLPPDTGLKATDRMVRLLWPLHSRLRRYRKLVSRVSPVHTYFHQFPELSDEHQRAWAFLDTHDALTDHYKWFRTRGQIRRALSSLGAVDVEAWKDGNGVEARGRRPATEFADNV